MNKRQFNWSTPLRALVVAGAMVSAAVPLIAQSQSAQEIYNQDRADCLAGRTQQSQADCLYEARSALRDRRNGDPELVDANPSPAGPSGDNLAWSSSAASRSSDGELAPRADRN